MKNENSFIPMLNHIYNTDAISGLQLLPDESVDCIVTSPPYWQKRDYGIEPITWDDGWVGQLGLEPTRELYINHLLLIFAECHRVLKKIGTMWVNLGDTYNHGNNITSYPSGKLKNSYLRQKSLCNIPGLFTEEMIQRGWILRNEIIWHKPSCIPSPTTDRFTIDYEKMFFFTKNSYYQFNQQFEPYAESTYNRYRYPMTNRTKSIYYQKTSGVPKGKMSINPKGRNMRCVWRIAKESSKESHFAMYPTKLVETPILAGSPDNGVVLDPFAGAGTTLLVAQRLGRNYIGIEPNTKYVEICNKRLTSK